MKHAFFLSDEGSLAPLAVPQAFFFFPLHGKIRIVPLRFLFRVFKKGKVVSATREGSPLRRRKCTLFGPRVFARSVLKRTVFLRFFISKESLDFFPFLMRESTQIQ